MRESESRKTKYSIRKILKYTALFLLLGAVLIAAALISPGIFGIVLLGGIAKFLIGFIQKKRSEKRKRRWFASTPAQRDAMRVSDEEMLRWMKE